MNCTNCNAAVTQNYCPNCGQAASLKRIDGHYITHEIQHVLHFEKGILYTIRELLIRPGQNVRHFITDNRNRLVKPIIFVIITSLVYTIINHFFHIEEGYVNYEEKGHTATASVFTWIQDHYGYSNIIMGIFIAGWTNLFFKKYPYNFFEILILLCFIMGMAMLIFSLFALISGITHYNLMQAAGIVGIVYSAWAIGQFFDGSKISGYLKALVAYLLGVFTFALIAIAIGTGIDLIMKH